MNSFVLLNFKQCFFPFYNVEINTFFYHSKPRSRFENNYNKSISKT
jgi:hypothetical protein